MHDLLHGIWHFEKGILFTLKQAFIRPGYMAMNYIKGKRIIYYNFFYLLLLVLGSNVLLTFLFENIYHINSATVETTNDKTVLDLTEFLNHNFKLLLFLLIPFFAINSLIVFRKMRLNIAEQSVVAGTILLCGAAWYFVFNLFYYLTFYIELWIIDIISGAFLFIIVLSPIIVYWQATRKLFSFMGYVWRIITWYILLLLEVFLIILFLYLVSGKESIVIN